MTLAVFHDIPGLENGLTKFHDFPGRVVTLHKAASPPQTDGSIIFSRLQLANMTELVLPSAHQSPQPKEQIDRTQPFLHSSRQSVVGHVGATWRTRLKLGFLRLTRVHNPEQIDWFSHFCT